MRSSFVLILIVSSIATFLLWLRSDRVSDSLLLPLSSHRRILLRSLGWRQSEILLLNRFEGPYFSYDSGRAQSGPHLLWLGAGDAIRADDFQWFVLTPRAFSGGPVATHDAWALADSRGGGVYGPHSPTPDFLLMTASRVQFPTIALVFVPLVPLVALLALVGLRTWRARKRFGEGCCAICGYDLQATPERCPECGTFTQTNRPSRAIVS